MADLTLTRNSELEEVVQVEGNTEAGVDFVDAWPGAMEVVDSGRIILPDDAVPALRQAALRDSLTILYEEQP